MHSQAELENEEKKIRFARLKAETLMKRKSNTLYYL